MMRRGQRERLEKENTNQQIKEAFVFHKAVMNPQTAGIERHAADFILDVIIILYSPEVNVKQ